jgi:hypothetical protein
MNMVTQKRLGTFNMRALSLVAGAVLLVLVAMLAAVWISLASSNGSATQTQAAPSYTGTYTGPKPHNS